jgi:hypothetical protein
MNMQVILRIRTSILLKRQWTDPIPLDIQEAQDSSHSACTKPGKLILRDSRAQPDKFAVHF